MVDASVIAAHSAEVRSRIADACMRAGRPIETVTLIGVTKNKPAEAIVAAGEAGIADVGENYVQELVEKHTLLGDIVRWHYIGHLQRNKVKMISPFVAMVHGVDSERLGLEINKQAQKEQRIIPVLLQVNTSGEESKFGVEPGAAAQLAEVLARLPNLELQGLMTLAAYLDKSEEVRPMFRVLRELRDSLRASTGLSLPHLSMGMTNDYEVAIEEGATLVRVGRAIFGKR